MISFSSDVVTDFLFVIISDTSITHKPTLRKNRIDEEEDDKQRSGLLEFNENSVLNEYLQSPEILKSDGNKSMHTFVLLNNDRFMTEMHSHTK